MSFTARKYSQMQKTDLTFKPRRLNLKALLSRTGLGGTLRPWLPPLCPNFTLSIGTVNLSSVKNSNSANQRKTSRFTDLQIMITGYYGRSGLLQPIDSWTGGGWALQLIFKLDNPDKLEWNGFYRVTFDYVLAQWSLQYFTNSTTCTIENVLTRDHHLEDIEQVAVSADGIRNMKEWEMPFLDLASMSLPFIPPQKPHSFGSNFLPVGDLPWPAQSPESISGPGYGIKVTSDLTLRVLHVELRGRDFGDPSTLPLDLGSRNWRWNDVREHRLADGLRMEKLIVLCVAQDGMKVESEVEVCCDDAELVVAGPTGKRDAMIPGKGAPPVDVVSAETSTHAGASR
ncbi:hypothetical protein DFH06DRAFT_1371689 [Mycena polygramma]|nr:hypothetical protein DFH06DRAFT_1371689 [Mycena polygramma]